MTKLAKNVALDKPQQQVAEGDIVRPPEPDPIPFMGATGLSHRFDALDFVAPNHAQVLNRARQGQANPYFDDDE